MTKQRLQPPTDPTRRAFLRKSFAGMGWMMAGTTLSQCSNESGSSAPLMSNIANLGPLQDPDENGLRLPEGFTSRIVAQSGTSVGDTDYVWHNAPDGGAVFGTNDGYIYVSNSEVPAQLTGGVSAIRFLTDGAIVDAYRILEDTSTNCAGGPTPWGTWLSCEEFETGRVHECDPLGSTAAVARDSMGVFKHEAAAVDEANRHVYMTEDLPDGGLYRFVYENDADLSAGQLQIAEVMGDGPEGSVEWRNVDDPSATNEETRYQVPSSTPFDGGEGMWICERIVYFSTKGDNRIWAYETDTSVLSIIYDAATSSNPILTGVDNVTCSLGGDVLVAEDGGDMQIVAITPDGSLVPIVQVVGQDASEITGPAFDPSFQRLYFSSQRGVDGNLLGMSGITYEITGPFVV